MNTLRFVTSEHSATAPSISELGVAPEFLRYRIMPYYKKIRPNTSYELITRRTASKGFLKIKILGVGGDGEYCSATINDLLESHPLPCSKYFVRVFGFPPVFGDVFYIKIRQRGKRK